MWVAEYTLHENLIKFLFFFNRGKKRAPPPPQIHRPVVKKVKPVLEDSDSDEENVSDESLDSD